MNFAVRFAVDSPDHCSPALAAIAGQSADDAAAARPPPRRRRVSPVPAPPPQPPASNQFSPNEDRRRRPSFLRRRLARPGLRRREGRKPMGPAERLHPRRGSERRVCRRAALWRRNALHQECRRCSRLLAGAVARLRRRRRRRAHHDAGLQPAAHRSDFRAVRRRSRLGLFYRRLRHDGADRRTTSSSCRSVPASGCGSAPISAISNSRRSPTWNPF